MTAAADPIEDWGRENLIRGMNSVTDWLLFYKGRFRRTAWPTKQHQRGPLYATNNRELTTTAPPLSWLSRDPPSNLGTDRTHTTTRKHHHQQQQQCPHDSNQQHRV